MSRAVLQTYRANASHAPRPAQHYGATYRQQRAATRAFTEQTATLNQKLTELSQAVGQTEEIAKQSLSLKKEVTDLREHLDALDAQLNRPKPALSPEPSPEDKW